MGKKTHILVVAKNPCALTFHRTAGGRGPARLEKHGENIVILAMTETKHKIIDWHLLPDISDNSKRSTLFLHGPY